MYLTREQELRKENQEHSTAKVFRAGMVPYGSVQNKLLETPPSKISHQSVYQ